MPRLLLATVAALALAAPAQAIGAAGGAGTTPIGLQSMGANRPVPLLPMPPTAICSTVPLVSANWAPIRAPRPPMTCVS